MRPARGPKNAGMGHPCQCATRQPQSSRPTRSFKEEALTLRLFRSLRDLLRGASYSCRRSTEPEAATISTLALRVSYCVRPQHQRCWCSRSSQSDTPPTKIRTATIVEKRRPPPATATSMPRVRSRMPRCRLGRSQRREVQSQKLLVLASRRRSRCGAAHSCVERGQPTATRRQPVALSRCAGRPARTCVTSKSHLRSDDREVDPAPPSSASP